MRRHGLPLAASELPIRDASYTLGSGHGSPLQATSNDGSRPNSRSASRTVLYGEGGMGGMGAPDEAKRSSVTGNWIGERGV